MDFTEQASEENQGKNLGMTLIQWIRMVNAKKFEKNIRPEKSLKNGKSSDTNHRGSELLSARIKNSNQMGNE